MNNEKINSFSVSSLIVALSGCFFYGIFSSYIINTTKIASLISLVIGYFFSLIISYLIFRIFRLKPKLNFNEKINSSFKILNIPIIFLLITCSLLIYILLTYRLTSFLSSQYLIETPKIFMFIIILFITYYIASKEIETVSRVATISLFLSIIIFIFDFISLIPEINFNNFLPLEINVKEVIKCSLVFSLYFSVPIFSINIIKYDNIQDKSKLKKYYYLTIFISFTINLFSLATTIGVQGINVSCLFDYPLYTVLKRISVFNFLDSIENISIMLWILYVMNSCSIILLFTLNMSRNLFKTKSKIIDLILMLISFIMPIIFLMNNNYVESFDYLRLPNTIFIILLILIVIINLKIKKAS